MTDEILEAAKARGGRRDGSGRKPIYQHKTVWPAVPIPADFAASFGSTDELRSKLVAWIRDHARADNLPWDTV